MRYKKPIQNKQYLPLACSRNAKYRTTPFYVLSTAESVQCSTPIEVIGVVDGIGGVSGVGGVYGQCLHGTLCQ